MVFPWPEGNRHLQPLTASTPATQRRHVGLGPGLVDEHQPGRGNPALILLPAGPLASHVRPRLLGGHAAFFEGQLLAMHEAPHSVIVDPEAARGEFRDQAPQGEVGLSHARPQPRGIVPHEPPRAMAAHRAGGRAAGRAKALGPFHNARRAEAQGLRDIADALARLHPRDRPLAQIQRRGACHHPGLRFHNLEAERQPFAKPHRFHQTSSCSSSWRQSRGSSSRSMLSIRDAELSKCGIIHVASLGQSLNELKRTDAITRIDAHPPVDWAIVVAPRLQLHLHSHDHDLGGYGFGGCDRAWRSGGQARG